MFNYSDLRFSKGTAYKIHSFTGSIFLVVKKQKTTTKHAKYSFSRINDFDFYGIYSAGHEF